MNSKIIHHIFLFFAIPIVGTMSISCEQQSPGGKLIVTVSPAGNGGMNMATGDAWRYLPGARIVLVDPEKPASPKILTEDFYSACSPAVSFDGNLMLFAAQQKENDLWQIWEMDLKKQKSRKITSSEENCTDPVFLPTGRIAFSQNVSAGAARTGHSLFTCNSDGSDVRQITFHPHADFATTVLMDGRLLSITRQLLPFHDDPMFMVLRPDGTKADLFYQGINGSVLLGRAHEASNGKLYFIETDSAASKRGNVVSIRYNRPLSSRENLSGGISGNFNAVFPLMSEKLIVSFQESEGQPFALFEFDISTKQLGERIYGNEKQNIVDVIRIVSHNRPKKLPSEVDMGVKTGLLLCQDINFTDMGIIQHDAAFKNANKIEVMGIDSTMGIVKAAKDGSFYLKVVADKPFQLRTLDKNGNVINSCAWLWIRPNERRGCIGCHENRELAPENNVPLAIKMDPVSIPVHVSDFVEKEVELE